MDFRWPASTYCKVVGNNILHQVYMGVVSRYEADAGCSPLLGRALDAGSMPNNSLRVRNQAALFMASVQHLPPTASVRQKDWEDGVQLLDFESQEIKSVVINWYP